MTVRERVYVRHLSALVFQLVELSTLFINRIFFSASAEDFTYNLFATKRQTCLCCSSPRVEHVEFLSRQSSCSCTVRGCSPLRITLRFSNLQVNQQQVTIRRPPLAVDTVIICSRLRPEFSSAQHTHFVNLENMKVSCPNISPVLNYSNAKRWKRDQCHRP